MIQLLADTLDLLRASLEHAAFALTYLYFSFKLSIIETTYRNPALVYLVEPLLTAAGIGLMRVLARMAWAVGWLDVLGAEARPPLPVPPKPPIPIPDVPPTGGRLGDLVGYDGPLGDLSA